MKSQLKLAEQRLLWIDRAMFNTSGLYGDIASIFGANLPQIGCLELSYIPAEADETLVEKAPWE